MSFRSYLIFMTLGTLTAWMTWAVVLHGVDPTRAGALGLLLFYITLTMALFGSISLLGMLIRLWVSRGEIASRIAVRSFRQGVLLTTLFVSSLLLFSQGWFRWWTMFLVVVIVGLVELTFLSSRKS
ncbi:hypothetical protein HQ487_00885 [Candidatus Uhrbacteria bacterium]|nr:hypothetical protein [Candidatus Uhrbacteria bacterium]